jgi:hypothetical protein
VSFNGMATPEQMKFLKQALDEYCAIRDITDEHQRDDAAYVIMSLFQRGVTNIEELRLQLDEIVTERERRRAG